MVAASKFLGRLAQLDFATLAAAIRDWREAMRLSSREWFVAEEAVAREITATGRYPDQERLLAHMVDVFRRAAWFTSAEPGANVGATDASGQYVATIAMLALLVRDRLRPGEFDVLYQPFARRIPVGELERE